MSNLLIFWTLILHLEGVCAFFFKKLFLVVQEQKNRLTKVKHSLTYSLIPLNIYLTVFAAMFVLSKKTFNYLNVNYLNAILLFGYVLTLLLLLAYWYFLSSGQPVNFFISFIVQNLFLFLFLLFFCDSFLIFLFILELFSVYYYFFFLNITTKTTKYTIIQYKNLLLFYLWNSFLTTILYGIGLFLLSNAAGTLNFNELYMLKVKTLYSGFIFIFVSLAWKLGLPGFHFLKIEIYKYLENQTIFFFSIVTVSLNLLLFYFFVLQPVTLLVLKEVYILLVLVLTMVFCLFFFFHVTHLYNFLAWSSVITLFTSLLLLLV